MSLAGFILVLGLTLAAIAFAILAVDTVALVRSTYYYLAHSCCLVMIYVVYAIFAGNSYLYIWAGLCLVNTWMLPFLQGGLMYTAKRIPPEERLSRLGSIIFAVLVIAAVAVVEILSSIRLVPAASPIDNLRQAVSVNFLAALLMFVYGIVVLVTHRHLFKLVLGLLFMTAGAHLTLIQMAPGYFSMVEIEILTKVIATVFAMLYAARQLSERFQTADAARLLRLSE